MLDGDDHYMDDNFATLSDKATVPFFDRYQHEERVEGSEDNLGALCEKMFCNRETDPLS